MLQPPTWRISWKHNKTMSTLIAALTRLAPPPPPPPPRLVFRLLFVKVYTLNWNILSVKIRQLLDNKTLIYLLVQWISPLAVRLIDVPCIHTVGLCQEKRVFIAIKLAWTQILYLRYLCPRSIFQEKTLASPKASSLSFRNCNLCMLFFFINDWTSLNRVTGTGL